MIGLQGVYNHTGPYSSEDQCGHGCAANILLCTLRQGKHGSTHKRFWTIKIIWLLFSNYYKSIPQSNRVHFSMVNSEGIYSRFSNEKCGSL